MNLVITGASGFIGSTLADRLGDEGHALVLLSRIPPAEQILPNKRWLTWKPGVSGDWIKSIDGADGIIHLAGEPIAGKRWSFAQKEKLRNSRIATTAALVDAIRQAEVKPKFLISSSAVGYYGARRDETLTEESAPGNGFLARLCLDWESEANKAKDFGVRVAILRTGIVLGRGKGALAKMVPPFRFFAGGSLGSGTRWFPWIHLSDAIGLIKFLIEDDQAKGPFNVTAPKPVTMSDFCNALAKALNRPSWLPAPAPLLSLMLGEMAEMLLTGQRAVPQAALGRGYQFKFANALEALESLKL
ncbi:MAG TPA: TIGR01777 family oxidoreductase [Candidatus Limnocylindrales bacterium]|nr:TIGR01777 family oxidoreductase [Candidatus Limnocylindrales bacterium]